MEEFETFLNPRLQSHTSLFPIKCTGHGGRGPCALWEVGKEVHFRTSSNPCILMAPPGANNAFIQRHGTILVALGQRSCWQGEGCGWSMALRTSGGQRLAVCTLPGQKCFA